MTEGSENLVSDRSNSQKANLCIRSPNYQTSGWKTWSRGFCLLTVIRVTPEAKTH